MTTVELDPRPAATVGETRQLSTHLRRETRGHHESAEAALVPALAVDDLAGYSQLLQLLGGWYLAVQQAIEDVPQWAGTRPRPGTGLAFDRIPHLLGDLRSVGGAQ